MTLLITIVILYVWHEIEEYLVLLPWHARHRHHLPGPFQRIALTRLGFLFIAFEQLALLVGIWAWLSDIWFRGAVVAYAFHLAIHCIQMFITLHKGFFLPLWSAPLQLPIIVGICTVFPAEDRQGLMVASLVMIGVMLTNLALLHWLASQVSQSNSHILRSKRP